MHADTFWGVFTPFLVLSLILGVPRWGEPRWLSFGLGKIVALCLLACGLVGAAVPAYFEARRLKVTIYDKWLPGSAEADAGQPLPSLTEEVHIRRPGVAHLLSLNPSKRTTDPDELPEIGVGVLVLGPDGRQVASFEEKFRSLGSSAEEDIYNWSSFEGSFTPTVAGPHRIVLTYRSPGIPTLLLHIEEPH